MEDDGRNGRLRRSTKRLQEFQQAKRAAARERLVRCVHQCLRRKLVFDRMQKVWKAWMLRNLARAKLRGLLWRAWTYPHREWRQQESGPLSLLSGRDEFFLRRVSRFARAAGCRAAELRSAGGTWRPDDPAWAYCEAALRAARDHAGPPAGEASSGAAMAVARACATASSSGAKRGASRSAERGPRHGAFGAVQHGKGRAKNARAGR